MSILGVLRACDILSLRKGILKMCVKFQGLGTHSQHFYVTPTLTHKISTRTRVLGIRNGKGAAPFPLNSDFFFFFFFFFFGGIFFFGSPKKKIPETGVPPTLRGLKGTP